MLYQPEIRKYSGSMVLQRRHVMMINLKLFSLDFAQHQPHNGTLQSCKTQRKGLAER